MMALEGNEPDLPLEFPEIQVVPDENDEKESKNISHEAMPVGQLSEGRKHFGRLAMKVITNIVESKEKKIQHGSPIPEQDEEEGVAGDTFPINTSKFIMSKATSSKSSISDLNTGAKGRDPVESFDNSPCSRRASVVPASKLQFASLVRLAKFRRMTSKFGEKNSRTSSRRTSFSDIEEEPVLPEFPRFCATLSPEAQYAMMKGYEDVLIQRLKSTQKNSLLFRVKTPHQKVAAIHLADINTHRSKDQGNGRHTDTGHLFQPGQDGLYKSFPASPQSSRPNTSESAQPSWRSKGWTTHKQPVFSMGNPIISKQQCDSKTGIPKEKQLKLSLRFQRAMDILDTLKVSEGLPVTSLKEKRYVTNPTANYNTWSQSWSREFRFQYTSTES